MFRSVIIYFILKNNRIIKFLSDGVFVQIALRSTNYCVSTFEAFKILISNPLKVSITGLISYIVLFFGAFFIVAAICTAAYFVQI